MTISKEQIQREQEKCLELRNQGLTRPEIAQIMNLSARAVKRRLEGARKANRLDPHIREQLVEKGITDFAGLHSGWLLEKDENGGGSSLYFHLGPDQEKIDFAEAMRDVLSDIPKLPKLPAPKKTKDTKDYANWLFLADLHLGGEYGCLNPVKELTEAIDKVVESARPAEKAVLCELGDLLDANDHKGVTPASGNPTDTIRDNHFGNTIQSVEILKHAAYRLLETHKEVELHLIRGNHDETAYIAVVLALAEHFKDNPRLTVFVPSCPEEEEFRVITWGQCGFFPHHGDKAKPKDLKDVWADQFPEEWNQCRMWRLIATGHFHTYKAEELLGAEHRQFGTAHRPNRWARMQGFFNRGRISILNVHKEWGLENENYFNFKPMLKGKAQ